MRQRAEVRRKRKEAARSLGIGIDVGELGSMKASFLDQYVEASVKVLNAHAELADRKWRENMLDCVNSKYFAALMIVFTLYALFADDIRLAATEKPADNTFYALSTIALVVVIVSRFVNNFITVTTSLIGITAAPPSLSS